MNYAIRFLAFAAAALCAAGCTSPRAAPEPGPDECLLCEVATDAMHSLLASSQFHRYVERYRARHKGRNQAIMFGRLGGKVDESEKPNANVAFIEEHLAHELVSCNMIEITKGYRPACITFAPDATPEQMEKGREAICGRRPDAVLRTIISAQAESLGGDRQVNAHQFYFALYDVADGQKIWQFSKNTGLIRTCR